MDTLSMKHLARNGSQKNMKHFSDNSSGTNSNPEKSNKTATVPVRKAKEPPTAKLGKSTVKTKFQKSIASDLDMKNELYNRNKTEKEYRKKMFTICSNIVDTFLKESIKAEKTASIDEPKEKLIAKLGKSTETDRIQKNIAL